MQKPQLNIPIYIYNWGLYFSPSIRKILRAHGYDIKLGFSKTPDDTIAVWGRKKSSRRGINKARKTGASLLTFEDSFIRSIKTGREGEPPIGLIHDHNGIFFDPNSNSDLIKYIDQSKKLSNSQLEHVNDDIRTLLKTKISKYNACHLDDINLPNDYILVVDQTYNDASVHFGGANASTFAQMLKTARQEHPETPILIKTHPETRAGKRKGYFNQNNTDDNVYLYDKAVSPWILISQARAIYCVTSQLGLEAIFYGHRPITFGRAFYAGLGLSDDRHPQQVQHKHCSAQHLFWAIFKKYCLWYDPYFNRASSFNQALLTLEAQAKQWRRSSHGVIFIGVRAWKRIFFKRMFKGGKHKPIFTSKPTQALKYAKHHCSPIYAWGKVATSDLRKQAQDQNIDFITIEDGFIRSRGLGANLIQPCSLVFDPIGIYYDPNHASKLEQLINDSNSLSKTELTRARALKKQYCAIGLSKYNLPSTPIKIHPPKQKTIVLVVGQVEDDQSVLKGCKDIKNNTDLLYAVRKKYPQAYIIYKPHPDVQNGLRKGAISEKVIFETADELIENENITDVIKVCDILCTMTSLAGFEALLHNKHVVCFGSPFYAGWGLTEDIIPAPARRIARPSLDHLVYASLISYPSYWDPITQKPCPVEIVVERFAKGDFGIKYGHSRKFISKIQKYFLNFTHYNDNK